MWLALFTFWKIVFFRLSLTHSRSSSFSMNLILTSSDELATMKRTPQQSATNHTCNNHVKEVLCEVWDRLLRREFITIVWFQQVHRRTRYYVILSSFRNWFSSVSCYVVFSKRGCETFHYFHIILQFTAVNYYPSWIQTWNTFSLLPEWYYW